MFECQIQKMRKFHDCFLGRVLKWPTWNLGQKMPKLAKIAIFRKLRQVEESASDGEVIF